MDRKIEPLLTKLISDKLGIDPMSIRSESRFCEDLGADSLDSVELILEIEKAFRIVITDEESRRFETVLDAAKLILIKKNSL